MRVFILGLLIALSACEKAELSAEDQARVDAQKIAAVERANVIPPNPISPQKILYDDMDENSLFGTGCAFVPAGGGLDPVLLTRADIGYLKLDDKIFRLAADKGGTAGPLGTWEKYDGRARAVELEFASGDGEVSGSQTVDYQAKLMITNGSNQVLYQADGLAQCGA